MHTDDDPASQHVHLVLLTINWNESVRQVAKAAIDACARHSAVRFTVGDGKGSSALAEWLVTTGRASNVDVRYIVAESLRDRMTAALNETTGWTLFLADDDPFTINYIDSLIHTARSAPATVATVAPTHYAALSGTTVTQLRVSPSLSDSSAARRLARSYENFTTTGVLFYAMIRTGVVREWFDCLSRNLFVPSYSDQLLTSMAAATGDIALTAEPTMLLRDESNWARTEDVIMSDARFYPVREMAFFHELFWFTDLVGMFAHRPDFSELLPPLCIRGAQLLPGLFQNFDARARLLGVALSDAHVTLLRDLGPTILRMMSTTDDDERALAVRTLCDVAQNLTITFTAANVAALAGAM